jgi:2-polyprenyl-3-methyl-5-hydroxy-6-metoxy-1,4-benzoquinol methylase
MKKYYGKRAKEYEDIYHRNDPVRQSEQIQIADLMTGLFSGKNVLEIACGTGYWTEKFASVAKSITGVDFAMETLEIAKLKKLPVTVKFIQDDAYALKKIKGSYDAGLANFWFSHVPKSRVKEFLNTFHSKLENGAIVFMADNVYIKGVGGELLATATEEEENTYKIRTLKDGSKHKVLKNYYNMEGLEATFSSVGSELKIETGKCFWWVSYKVRASHIS